MPTMNFQQVPLPPGAIEIRQHQQLSQAMRAIQASRRLETMMDLLDYRTEPVTSETFRGDEGAEHFIHQIRGYA